jgi:ADP-heptose:LPS heptosyltransferase
MKLGYFLRKKTSQTHQIFRRLSYITEYLSWFLFSTSKFKKMPKSEDIHKILIINEGALGDVFCSIKVAHTLKIKEPNKEISLLIPENLVKELKFLECSCGINIISEKDLNHLKFDITFFFTLNKKFAKYKGNLGFCIGNEYAGISDSFNNLNNLFLNRKVFPRHLHKYIHEFNIIKKAGINLNFINSPQVKINQKLKINRDFVVMHASGKNFSEIFNEGKIPAYSWPLERFAHIADYISDEYNYQVILTGTKDESFINEQIIFLAKNKKHIHNLAGKLDIKSLVAMTQKAKLIVSIDTSMVHIAELINTPTVALHGPGFPDINGAFGNNNQINLFHPEKCVKCRRKSACPEGENICMQSITTEEVKKNIEKIITRFKMV